MTSDRLDADMHDVRTMLIDRIKAGRTPVTYGEVADHTARIAHGMGPLLDELEYDCAARGEPNLAVLVVNQDSWEPTKYARRADDWTTEQQRCHQHTWQDTAATATRRQTPVAVHASPQASNICPTCHLTKPLIGLCPYCDQPAGVDRA